MKKISLLLMLVVMATVSVCAQTAIRWQASVAMKNKSEGVLTVKAVVAPGWHLYGTAMPKEGPNSTKLDFSGSTGVEFTGAFTPSVKPVTRHDDMFGITLSWWDRSVTFTRPFKLKGKKGDAAIVGKITFMGCNDKTCLPPKTETINLKLK